MIPEEAFLRVKENLGGMQKGPYCIDLIINNFCNLRCLYCSGSIAHAQNSSLSNETLARMLDSAHKSSVKEISLTSLVGEPTMFKEIKPLMEAIKNKGFIGTLLTNGSRLDLEFAQFLHRINWDILIISLDSFDPGIQYKLRPSVIGNDYLNDIIMFLEYTVKNNPRMNINLNMVVSNLNYANVQDYFKIAQRYGVKHITLLKLMKMTDYYAQLVLSDSQNKDFKHLLRKISPAVDYNRMEWFPDDLNSVSNEDAGEKSRQEVDKNCYFHLFKMLINCDGAILKCNGDSQKTEFNIYGEDLQDSYKRLAGYYRNRMSSPACWDSCCSPIKALNQEIGHSLAWPKPQEISNKVIAEEFNITEFYIAITNRCNLRCIMCTTGQGKYTAENELSADQWIKAIANLNKNCHIRRITFGGGEPLLRQELAEIVKFACGTKVSAINIISNGTLITKEFMDKFSPEELSKISITLSIDGLSYDHNFIRGTEAFERAFKSFEMLYYDYFTPKIIVNLSLSSILMPENFANYIVFLDFFKKYKGLKIDIQPVIPNNELCYVKKTFQLTALEKEKLKEIVKYVCENSAISSRQEGMIRFYPKYFDNQLTKSQRCTTGFESLNITYNGLPYLCGKEIAMPVNQFDFKDIFNSPGYQTEIERIKLCKEPCLQGLHINPNEKYE